MDRPRSSHQRAVRYTATRASGSGLISKVLKVQVRESAAARRGLLEVVNSIRPPPTLPRAAGPGFPCVK